MKKFALLLLVCASTQMQGMDHLSKAKEQFNAWCEKKLIIRANRKFRNYNELQSLPCGPGAFDARSETLENSKYSLCKTLYSLEVIRGKKSFLGRLYYGVTWDRLDKEGLIDQFQQELEKMKQE